MIAVAAIGSTLAVLLFFGSLRRSLIVVLCCKYSVELHLFAGLFSSCYFLFRKIAKAALRLVLVVYVTFRNVVTLMKK